MDDGATLIAPETVVVSLGYRAGPRRLIEPASFSARVEVATGSRSWLSPHRRPRSRASSGGPLPAQACAVLETRRRSAISSSQEARLGPAPRHHLSISVTPYRRRANIGAGTIPAITRLLSNIVRHRRRFHRSNSALSAPSRSQGRAQCRDRDRSRRPDDFRRARPRNAEPKSPAAPPNSARS